MRYAVASRAHRATRSRHDRVVAHLRAAGHEVVEVRAADPEEARTRLAPLLADGAGPEALVVIGGDGAASLGASLCAGTDVALGLVPAGTGNDNARSFGIPSRTDAALQVLTAGRTRTVDTMLVTHGEVAHRRLGAVSCALDARISARVNGWPRGMGPLAYTAATLAEIVALGRHPVPRLQVELDDAGPDSSQTLEVLVLIVHNMPYIGGGMRVAPDADPADGRLELLTIGPVGPRDALRLLRGVRDGSHVDHAAVDTVRCSRVRVTGPERITAQADGEPLPPWPLTIEVDPASLRVLAP